MTTKAPSAAVLNYVTSVCRRKLGEGTQGVELKEYGPTTVSYFKDQPFALYWLEGEQIVFRFRRPKFDDLRKKHAKYFIELKTPVNWLEYRRPLSRDPRPDLQSAMGAITGKARHETLDGMVLLEDLDLDTLLTPHDGPLPGTLPTHISSEGAPYIVLPRAKVAKYPGASDEALYKALCSAASEPGSLAKTQFGPALLLGTPDNLYFYPNEGGGLLVRVVCYDPDDDEQLAKDIASLPDEGWEPIEGALKATGPWCAFDAALEAPSESEVLTLKLARGSYQLSSRTALGDDFEFMIVRLKRA